MKKFFLFLIILILYQSIFAEGSDTSNINKSKKYLWANSVFQKMTLEEKIAQIMMIRVHSDNEEFYNKKIIKLISKYNIGGVCFFKGSPLKQVNLYNRILKATKTPVMSSIDGEWGLSMRLEDCLMFPRQLPLGAIQNDSLIYEMGREIARQFFRMGIDINFAPVADVNSNPNNPVINSRSFGSDPIKVANKALIYMKGMQDQGLIACAKHFPGHGDTETDSHNELPIINHSIALLDSIDLYPFKVLINNGLKSIMIAHLAIPAYDTNSNMPSSLSKNVVTDLLRTKMNFKGLIISDALDMQGVTNHYKTGEIELKALLAGNDILLLSAEPEEAIKYLANAVKQGVLPIEIINEKCLNILKLKEDYKINKRKKIKTKNLLNDINNNYAKYLIRKLTESSITIVNNIDDIIPLSNTDYNTTALLSIGKNNTRFQEVLSIYGRFTNYYTPSLPDSLLFDSLISVLSAYKTVVVGIHNTIQLSQRNYDVTDKAIELLDSLSTKTNVIVSIFGNPYILKRFKTPSNFKSIVQAYQPTTVAEESAAKVIMGAISANGKIPVSVSDSIPINTGVDINSIQKIDITEPLNFNLKKEYFNKIDSIIYSSIKNKIFPGCQLAIVYKNNLIYNKGYGSKMYNEDYIKPNNIYDIASITKVTATTLAIMKLFDEGLIKLEEPASKYLPILKNSNKESITIADLLTHTAGLKPYIPFWKNYVLNNNIDTNYIKKNESQQYNIPIADSLFMNGEVEYNIIQSIIDSPVDSNKKYTYSDFGFIILKLLVESVSKQYFEKYLDSVFYQPLGLSSMCFLPRESKNINLIVPTELDNYFRNQLICGYVHDQTSALMGGVSGHAGNFSNASDVAIIMQMLLNGGKYGNQTFFNQQTVALFTDYWFKNNFDYRRGLGFDKPSRKEGASPCSNFASQLSFGHSGFTGTLVWTDPKYNLIYVFLSNRVYPNAENNLLAKLNIRTQIQDLIYKAINNN